MKIKIIEPVIETENTKGTIEERELITRCLSKNVDFDIEYIKYGPESIESISEENYAIPGIIDIALQAEKDNFDGIFINCFADPGVLASKELVDIPVFGGFVPSILTALAIGDNISILGTSSKSRSALNYAIKSNGFKDKIASTQFLDITVLDLLDKEKTISKMVDECIKAEDENNADVVVLGCTVLSNFADELRERLKKEKCYVKIIDPKMTGLKFLKMLIEMNITNSIKNKIITHLENVKWY